MAHTDFSTIENVAQYDTENGTYVLVVDLDSPSIKGAIALGGLDQIASETLMWGVDQIAQGTETLDSLNGSGSFLWIVDLSDVMVSA